jgi:isochorismate synthase
MPDRSVFAEAIQKKGPFLFLVPAGEFREENAELLDLSRFQSKHFVCVPFASSEKGEEDVEISERDYHQILQEIIHQMQKGEYGKVVFSRIKKTSGSEDPRRLEEIFRKLVKAYPTAFVFFFRSEDDQLWMGASPELLFRRRSNRFETMALAGTQKRTEGKDLEEYTWGFKEIEEHKVVVDFISDKIKEAGARKCEIGEMKTVAAGNLVHLKTEIFFEGEWQDSEIAELLHPTPAVCGFPREKAREVIDQFEPHKRQYYAGYIGIPLPNGDVDYIVNLRCMRIYADHFSLYVGGGINAQSNVESEWLETELKSQTLLNVIHSVGG